MSSAYRPVAVLPTYDNPRTVRNAVLGVREHLPDVILVDDGSGDAGREACDAIARDGLATVVRFDRNRGKGAAVKAGFRRAQELGFSHAFQIDSDGQHDLARIPDFLARSADSPEALVIGYPEYDASAPRARVVGRRFTLFWVGLEVGDRNLVADAMIGFRVYPVEAALASGTRCDRMGFDIEIVVQMARAGVPMVNLPVHVRYLSADEGGVSHFRMFRDNVGFSAMHARLCTVGCFRWIGRVLRGRA